jgi:hypothetical protein
MVNTLSEGIRAQPVELYQDSDSLILGRQGKAFQASCAIAVADTTAADAPIFALTRRDGIPESVYIEALYGSLIFNGTATATGKNGVYFERYNVNTAIPSGGTAITLLREAEFGTVAEVVDCRFHTGALTVSGITYEGAKFGRYTIPISASGVAVPFYIPFGRGGLRLGPGEGLAMRLTYQAVVGLFVDLNVQGVVA